MTRVNDEGCHIVVPPTEGAGMKRLVLVGGFLSDVCLRGKTQPLWGLLLTTVGSTQQSGVDAVVVVAGDEGPRGTYGAGGGATAGEEEAAAGPGILHGGGVQARNGAAERDGGGWEPEGRTAVRDPWVAAVDAAGGLPARCGSRSHPGCRARGRG